MMQSSEYLYEIKDTEKIAKRPERSNKFTFGRVLFVCGSHGMAGASFLAALAAYRMGAGLCELYIPECNRAILQTLLPEAVVRTHETADLSELAQKSDTIGLGGGRGKSDTGLELVKTVLQSATCPVVIDADALNLISEHQKLKNMLSGRIITPHFAEMARLSGESIQYISDNTRAACVKFAKEHGCVCVLKDHNTVVSDGRSVYINKSGNPGMATAGMGDVLAGIIGALLARNGGQVSAVEATAAGAYLHGAAGDRAAALLGEYSLMASDVLSQICNVIPR